MTQKTRLDLKDSTSSVSASVSAQGVTFFQGVHCIFSSHAFFSDVVDALLEVTGDDTYENIESELRSERARCAFAEAQVRALESQLTAMRALLQPKPIKPEMED